MLSKLDDLHYSFRKIDGYNKPFNLIVSAREAGKSTIMMVTKIWSAFLKGYPSLVLRRQIVDITELYIDSLQAILNKFIKEDLKFIYKLGDIKSGSVKIYCENPKLGKKELLMVIIGLSQKVQRIKSNVILNLYQIFFDEYIINPKFKETYLPYEFDKLKEVYTTFKREFPEEEKAKGKFMKIYFMANPYTVYTPFSEAFHVDYKQMIPGTIISGDSWAIENYKLLPELVAKIQKENPFYKENDEYTNYALNGIAINDLNIRLGKLENNYLLKFVVSIDGQKIGIYRNNNKEISDTKYHCAKNPPKNINRDVYCFDFNDLASGKILYNKREDISFDLFRNAMRNNWVTFDDIGTYYKILNIYNLI